MVWITRTDKHLSDPTGLSSKEAVSTVLNTRVIPARSPSTQKKSITFSTHSRQKIKMTNRGAWIPIGVAIGVAISVATKDPTWIAVGVALGAGLSWTRPRKDCRPDKED